MFYGLWLLLAKGTQWVCGEVELSAEAYGQLIDGQGGPIASSFTIKGTQIFKKMRFHALHAAKVRLYAL